MTNDSGLLKLISSLKMYKVENLATGDEDYADVGDRVPAGLAEANVVSSLRTDRGEVALHSGAWWGVEGDPDPQHALLLDLDVPAYLVPSSTPGHSHLYVDVRIPKSKYMHLLKVLADVGVIEEGYQKASEIRGTTALRLPWVRKDPERDKAFALAANIEELKSSPGTEPAF